MSLQPDDNSNLDPSVARPTSDSHGSGSRGDEPTRVIDGSDAASAGPQPVPLGPSIAGYVLKNEVHRGGQGIVYRAIQLGTKRQVALKVLLEGPFAGEVSRRRFEREIELAASLRHPNIVTILDSGVSAGRYFFAMEYIDGLRLDRYLAQKRPRLAETLLLFEKVCLAVNFAHQRGVIHRDLKPPNILVSEDGEPHVLDFGLAKPVHALSSSETTVQVLSTAGQLLGTVAYMSPEQAAGSEDIDVRSDVYSLGVVFYEAVVGQPPYPVDGPLGEVLRRIAQHEPLNPRSVVARAHSTVKVDDELATILLKALEKEPPRRYQTAGDLARDFHHLAHAEPIEAKRASGLYMFKKTLRRYRLQATMAGLVLLMLFGFLIVLAVLWSDERDARRRADEKTEETRLAVISQENALREARERTTEAMLAQENLRRALGRQHIQRGDLALERRDLIEARDAYWKALEVAPGPAAIWALRRYYLQTPDSDATLVTFEPRGPGKLSPNGRLAAACAGPESIVIHPLEKGAGSSWMRAPGPITCLDVTDIGAVAAAGQGWARAWPPGALSPSVAVQLGAGERTHAVYATADGRGLLLMAERRVQLISGPIGEHIQTVLLQGTPNGPADYASRSQELAVPTSAGVELVSITEDGALRNELVWIGSAPARAVRFDGEELLAVLADAVYVASVADLRQGHWTRFISAATDWELFDLKHGVGVIAFATRDGRLAVYRRGELVTTWRYAVERLENLRLSGAERGVVTLDNRGTVTQWVEPERVEQRRLLHASLPTTWAAAGNGSVVLLAVGRGQVIACSSDPASAPKTVLRPRLLAVGDGGMALAVDDTGTRAVIRDQTMLRLVTLPDLATRPLLFTYSTPSVPDKVALSGDGQLIALLVRSPIGDRQQIVFSRWPAAGASGVPLPPPEPFTFVGALVRDLLFVPGTHQLMVVRSNGHLVWLDPDAPAAAGAPQGAAGMEPRSIPTPWLHLDVPATAVAFNRTGEYLAAAGEDGVIRLIGVARREVRHRIPAGRDVSALAFNPRDDILLVRTADGTVRLFDPATGESLATWQVPAHTERPLAAWLGDTADAMLLGQEGGVYEYRYAQADAVIERNRPYALEQRVLRCLADADFSAAWSAANELRGLRRARGERARVGVLESVLRRSDVPLPDEWATAAISQTLPANRSHTYARLGHAAYDGERFELARQWLQHSRELATDPVDALTLWRVAECDYLAEDYAAAVQGLGEAVARPDFDPAQLPTVALQRVAALVLANQPELARRAARQIGGSDPHGRFGDIVATTYARVIAAFIAGIERENAQAAALDSLLGSFGDRPLLYRDDEHFFGGELARLHGDLAQAAVKYQRCIDLARDVWPANWARYRLKHLSGRPAAGALSVAPAAAGSDTTKEQ